MTDKEFVLSIDPKARVIHLKDDVRPMMAKKFYISSFELYFWDAQGSTRKAAWAAAARFLEKRFLEKLGA